MVADELRTNEISVIECGDADEALEIIQSRTQVTALRRSHNVPYPITPPRLINSLPTAARCTWSGPSPIRMKRA